MASTVRKSHCVSASPKCQSQWDFALSRSGSGRIYTETHVVVSEFFHVEGHFPNTFKIPGSQHMKSADRIRI